MSIEMVRVADYLLLRLKELGLEKVFQVPGDYVQEFMTALDEFECIDAVGDLTELGAGYAADGYARCKGIGAVSVQYGVGTFSVLNAIAGAYVERNPIVVITASPSLDDRAVIAQTGALFHHATDDLQADKRVFESVTVASEILSDKAQAPCQIDRALTLAMTEKRPIYLEAWQNVWGEKVPAPTAPLLFPLLNVNLNMQTQLVEDIESRLRVASYPLLLFGIEVARLGLEDKAATLLDVLNVPYTTTTLAKSVLDESQGTGKSHFIGTYAAEASNPETSYLVNKADAIIALGAIFTDDYLTMLTTQSAQLARVNMSEARVGLNSTYLHISLEETIDQLIERFVSRPLNNTWLQSLQKNYSCHEEYCTITNKDELITYERFFDVFQAALRQKKTIKEANLILGESSSLYMAARLTGIRQNHFISDAAWGSLGHETGCALGVKLASQRQTIVIAGDGGFMMMAQALSTLARNQCNCVVFVMSNRVYAIEQSFVDICAFTPNGDFAPFDELPQWHYESLAKAFSNSESKIDYFAVESVACLEKVLDHISPLVPHPTLVEVKINKHDLAPAIKALAESVTGKKIAHCQTYK
ncbi:pyruvate decarboxylase [Vibrio navarrensis]|uniref:thiamine pyrophosphate-binding protein n=1 Tax=Vibrio navarrensis TaxID=29495 RepID=UPI00192F3171|nr:thiamine pyrophosphate-binding protein [Vibrio navarrensis]MBE3668511.1 pyruvate decarboxylase [Vibrio navarrensis]